MADLERARALLIELQEALTDDTAAPLAPSRANAPDPDEHVLTPPEGARVNLAVIVGHHARAKGAVSPWIGAEWDVNRAAAHMIERAAIGTGCNVEVFHRDPQTGSISDVARRVNTWARQQPDVKALAVSLHFNSFTTAQANGTETLYADISKPGEAWAGMLQRCMLNCFGLTNRGLLPVKRKGRGGTILYQTAMPCALLEPGFGSNERDARAIRDHWPEFAKELVSAALVFSNGGA